MNIKFKKLHPDAKLPQHAKSGDAGMDLVAIDIIADDYGNWTHHYGIAVEIPEGNVGLLMHRSSVYKQDQMMTNCVGVIDSGYRGEVMGKFLPVDKYPSGSQDPGPYNVGERTAQLLIVPVRTVRSEWAEELSDSERGADGHGSTGA